MCDVHIGEEDCDKHRETAKCLCLHLVQERGGSFVVNREPHHQSQNLFCLLLAAILTEINTGAVENGDREPWKGGGIAQLVLKEAKVSFSTNTYGHFGCQDKVTDVS